MEFNINFIRPGTVDIETNSDSEKDKEKIIDWIENTQGIIVNNKYTNK